MGEPKVLSSLKPYELQYYFAPFSKAAKQKRVRWELSKSQITRMLWEVIRFVDGHPTGTCLELTKEHEGTWCWQSQKVQVSVGVFALSPRQDDLTELLGSHSFIKWAFLKPVHVQQLKCPVPRNHAFPSYCAHKNWTILVEVFKDQKENRSIIHFKHDICDQIAVHLR